MTREEYAEKLVPLAMRLIGAVHDEGPDAVASVMCAVRAIEAPPDVDPMTAWSVVLAAAVDPRRRMSQLLAWTTRFDGVPVAVTDADVRAFAVEKGVAGQLPASALTDEEAAEVVAILMDQGWPQDRIRDHLHGENVDVKRWCGAVRARRRRAAVA